MSPRRPRRRAVPARLSTQRGARTLTVAALAATTVFGGFAGSAAQAAPPPGNPDLGPNVIVLDPTMAQADIQAKVDANAAQQVSNEMGTARYSVFFKPGVYGSEADPLVFQVGFYTEVAGPRPEPWRRHDQRLGRRLQPVHDQP